MMRVTRYSWLSVLLLVAGSLILSSTTSHAATQVPPGLKTDPFIPPSSCYGDGKSFGSAYANICDGNDATVWVSKSGYPHFAIVNLSASNRKVTSVAIHWETSNPDTWDIDFWNLTTHTWDQKYHSTSTPTDNTNVSYTITSPIVTNTTRLRGETGSSNFLSVYEIRSFGFVPAPPPNFSISASNTTVSFRLDDIGHTSVTATGLNGFSGNVTLNETSTPPGITAVCYLPWTRPNGTPSACTLSGQAPGEFDLTITGRNATIGNRTLIVHIVVLPASSWVLPLLVLVAIALATLTCLILSWWFDTLLWFMPAGVFVFLLAFQMWSLTASLPASLSIVATGIIILTLPIMRALKE